MTKNLHIKNKRRGIRATIIALIIAITCVLSCACTSENAQSKKYKSLDDLQNAKFALSVSNSSYENQIREELPNITIEKYTNYFDTYVAVAQGKADTTFSFKYVFKGLKESYPDFEYVESSIQIPIVANFSSNANGLKAQFNQFIKDSRENGTLEKLADKWIIGYETLTEDDVVDFSDLSGENGSFTFATENTVIPYEFLTNGELTGFEPALLHEFCKAYGYKPEIVQTKFDSVVAGVSTGKYDMGMNGYGYTEERAANSNFSEPYFYDNVVYIVNGGGEEEIGFFEKLKQSFERNFIVQDRWKLLLDGLLITLMVTVLSVALGSALGFLLFMASRKSRRLTRISLAINETLEALPILVVSLIFFYVIFGKIKISGTIVSIIVFTMSFMFTFFALMCNSARGIPKDQTEAGLALGYTNRQTLFKIVLPQAMEAFIPSIRSAIVATLKSTSIVGYVAVQDLTKAGDIIRSQTFDAFFPIITVALLYLLIAKFLIRILNKAFVTPSEKRAREKAEKEEKAERDNK